MVAAKVLPDYLSAALACTKSLNCPLAVGEKWRKAGKRLEDGGGDVRIEEVCSAKGPYII